MTENEQNIITELEKCDFTKIHNHLNSLQDQNKDENEEKSNQDKYGYCTIDDNSRVRIGTFKISPPGLLLGRKKNPKNGKIRKRVQPEDVTINCSANSKHPVAPQKKTGVMLSINLLFNI